MSAFAAAAQDEDGDIISALRARVADLEAQLYAVGAGGVGKLEQPQSVTNCHQSQPQVNSPEIQEGWRLVPVEPADSQIRAAQDTWWYACNCETYWDQIYAAMIAAAPQPPVVEQPQGGQEPVAWMDAETRVLYDHDTSEVDQHHGFKPTVPLYTHPQPQRQPLTDAQINDHRLALPYDGEDLPDPWDFKQGVRAAERAHRIGGEA